MSQSEQKLVAGVDSSTQSVKLVIRNAVTGELVRSGRATHPDGTEVNPTLWADALDQAIAAAGGIADQRGVLAAFALGAKGVQVGTVLLATKECPVHENYKQKVIKAKDTDTVVTGRGSGAPVRVLKNRMAVEYLNMSMQGVPLIELEKLTLGSLRKAVFDGDLDGGSFMAGQVSGLVKEVKTVQEVLEALFDHVNEYKSELEVM